METFRYDDDITKKFIWATVVWGLLGICAGLAVASQLIFPGWNLAPWLTLGRLRPVHTNVVIFAFCGNAIFAAVYESSQRLLKTPMWSFHLSRVHFYGWQLLILLSVVTLPMGYTSSKEYAEMEWPIDVGLALIWVVFAINYFMTVLKRREEILYVSIWFYIATIVAVGLLHVVNSLALPVTLFKSYSVYSGVQDALVQWWYGHNAVAFILTTPFLGLSYYFIPKATAKPVFSYPLSVVHFWSLIFIYIWAGPHHLQYSSLPEWLQSLGMVFSIMLIAPSWGGGLNLLFTLQKAWGRVREEPILKFFATAVIFYLLATLEGSLLSIKFINGVVHNTDWIIGHVHSGTLGWNGLLIFGVLYWLVPKIYQTPLHSPTLVGVHYWFATTGLVLYVISMWVSGLTQGLMTQALSPDGSLQYPNYIEIVATLVPLHGVRLLGGLLYVSGFLLMAYNLLRTALAAVGPQESWGSAQRRPVLSPGGSHLQAFLERKSSWMWAFISLCLLVGTLVEIAPLLIKKRTTLTPLSGQTPYSPLALEGRDIYIREGCNNCHTQMVRPMVHETKRYGPYSEAGEYVNDFPHLWGSKRTGPDLFRVGGKYNNAWHWKHMVNPRDLTPQSIMPAYPHLAQSRVDFTSTIQKVKALKSLGVNYPPEEMERAGALAVEEAIKIVGSLTVEGIVVGGADVELVALIAYLQRLGKPQGPISPQAAAATPAPREGL